MEEEKSLNGGDNRKSAGKMLMATVKGDVHDIGVILECNNYKNHRFGRHGAAGKDLETARAENVVIIALTSLITPRLDEIADMSAEMEREGMKILLMITCATTFKIGSQDFAALPQ